MAITISKVAILPIASHGGGRLLSEPAPAIRRGQEEYHDAEAQSVRPIGSQTRKGGGRRRLPQPGPRARPPGGDDSGLVRTAPGPVDLRRLRRVRRRSRAAGPSQRTDRAGADGAGAEPARVAAGD